MISTSGGSLDFCTLQVYANGTYKLYSDCCPPQVYATSLHSQDFCSVQYRYMLSACSGVNYATIPPVCGYVVDNFQYPSNDCGRNVNEFFFLISMKLTGKIPYMQNSQLTNSDGNRNKILCLSDVQMKNSNCFANHTI